MHRNVADDGTNVDLSTSGALKIYAIRSSPFLQATAAAASSVGTWDGGSGLVAANGSAYCRADFFADGHVEYTFKGSPYTAVTHEPTVLAGPFSTAVITA